jgi:hypothetical protein
MVGGGPQFGGWTGIGRRNASDEMPQRLTTFPTHDVPPSRTRKSTLQTAWVARSDSVCDSYVPSQQSRRGQNHRRLHCRLRMSDPHDYPRSVEEVLDPTMTFKPEVVRCVRRFARSKPWRGTTAERREKFRKFHVQLAAAFDIKPPRLILAQSDASDLGNRKGTF